MSDNGTELHDLNSLNHEPRTILNLNVDYEGSEEEDSDEDVSDTEPSPGEIQFSLIRMLQCPDEFQDFDEAHLTLARVLSITPEGDDSVSLIYEMYQNLCEKHAERPQVTETRSSLPLVTQVEDDDQNLARLHALGIALKDQYDREGQLSDLQRAIGCMMELVRLSDEDEPEFPERLAGLGTSLLGRFERLGTAQDLENAINYQRTAISLTVDAQPKLLSNLGFSLMRRFELHGRLDDLEDAINSQEQAMLAAATEDEDTPLWLTALGDSLILKFEYLSDLASVDRAIDLYERALQLDLDADRRSTILNNLGSALQRRFMHVKDLNNIDSAIKFQNEAVLLTSENHSNMLMWLTNLGNSLQLRFEHLGESKDINLAIIHQEHALRLLPKRHALRSGILNDLGNSLRWRFDRWGEPADIDRAVALLSESLSLSSGGHTSRPRILDNLGSALRQRFETRGVLLDIDQAITALGEAVSLSTEGHMDQAERLNHLGNAYATRFERLGELSDLEHAIKSHRKAVSLSTQDSAKTISILADLGSSLFTRFRLSHDMSDIDEAIVSQRESISLSNTELSVTPGLLNNLGTSLQFRYHRSNQLVDIDESISCLEKSIALTPDDHADKPFWLDNLCKSFRSRFERVGDLDDIEQAVDCQTRAVNLTPNSHTSRPDLLNCLADVLAVRCSTVPGRLADLDSIVDAYRQAASAPAGKPITRFRAAYSWAKMATLNGLSPLEAYKVALDVIPQVAWLGTSINRRYQELSSLGSVVTDAIANAISEREYNLALEWLEEGRSIVWRQLLQLRTPMDELRSVDAPKADRLEQIARALDQAGSSNSIKSMSQVAEASLEQAAQNHRRLAEDWNKLLDEVRQITGFSDFLRPKKASELIKAAHDGPVIAINVQKESCDALVLLPGATDVSCIPLPSLTFEKAADAQKHLMRSLRLAGVRLRTERRPLAKPTAPSPNQLEGVLDLLWTDVVKPILDHLNFLHPTSDAELPHITWCATGPLAFLPLHAAGNYKQPQPHARAFNYVVSSYTPTIGGLTQPSIPSAFLGILAVGQASTPGQSSLPGTVKELECIARHAGSLPFTQLMDHAATPETVLSAINTHSWVHFACHASQNPNDPTTSAFYLHDGTLDLATITKQPLGHKAFAFLSACQTATGDESLPEEAVHLAAGMIMAGYPTVIATMWSIKDNDAPLIAEHTYAELLAGGNADSTKASRALHYAVGRLRDKVGEKAFASWVPYIHVGI